VTIYARGEKFRALSMDVSQSQTCDCNDIICTETRRREGRSEVDDIISPSMSTPNLKQQAHGSTSLASM